MGGRPTASFASNSKRQGKAAADALGDPGGYDIEHAGVHLGKNEPIWARSKRSFNRDVNGGRGSFNSSATRSSSAPPRSRRGGPGEHDYSHMYSCGNASTQVTSSFLSSTPLGGHVRKSDTPGVGEYEPSPIANKSFTREGSAVFAGSATSRGGDTRRAATGDHVGPGSYDLEQSSIQKQMAAATNPRLPGFGSSSIRERSFHTCIPEPRPLATSNPSSSLNGTLKCPAALTLRVLHAALAHRRWPRLPQQLSCARRVRRGPKGDALRADEADIQHLSERRQSELWHVHAA